MSQAAWITGGGGNTPATFTFTTVTNGQSPFTATNMSQFISVDPTASGNTTTTITLPSNPTLYTIYTIKDRTGVSSTNHILVTAGGKTIDGQTTYTIAGNYGAINLLYDGTAYEVW
jgi:hypothetical protein